MTMLSTWQPFRNLTSLQERMNRIFDEFFTTAGSDTGNLQLLAEVPVEAKVEFGVVHLMGSVLNQEQASSITNKVRNVPGVIGVENELAVRPSPLADLQLTSFINDDVHR